MILGSHNSWTYLSPKKWWMKALAFTAKCQKYDIKTAKKHLEKFEIYGAIWTDKGLIYVAKMNDKGELELL